MSSFAFDDGFVLEVGVFVTDIISDYGRKVSWISSEEDDAIHLYYRPDFGEFCCFVMVDWMILYQSCVSCPEAEWTGDDWQWHTLKIQLVGNSIELSRDGSVDFTIDDDSLAYFSSEGFVQLSTLGALCCFDNVSLVSFSSYLCGDADASGAVEIDDVVYVVDYIFSNGPIPQPLEAADPDCSGAVEIDDVVYLLTYIFSGGSPPCEMCR